MIELQHATLLYGTVIGVNDFHLHLPAGAYALVGPNGAGKSTLIGLLTGSLRPTLGYVRIFGADPVKHPQVLQRIGLCPASDLLIQGATARQWLTLQLALSGWRRKIAGQRVDQLLQIVGLKEAADLPIQNYSLGMRQRCKLAQAIANDPDLLILDEPFNGLDPIGRHQMGQLLRDWTQQGKSLILASHVLHEVERITNAFLLIYGGRLLASGTAGELRKLLAGLPQEVVIKTSSPAALASRLAGQDWLRRLQRTTSTDTFLVSVDRPLELFQSLAEWISKGEIAVTQLTGSSGDISALFHLLVSRHRGESKVEAMP
ncbi:MAG TPA: ABC transporter ATP-binding protein [Planctomycetaceae bacterium]|nr:ABC transporter ATP-binding protein [Planctomycetaceae bacterium]